MEENRSRTLNSMMRKYKAIVFDLDGTLIDSALVLQIILNKMRGELGLLPLPLEKYRKWSSEGGIKLIANSMEINESDIRSAEYLLHFRDCYSLLPTLKSSVYAFSHDFLELAYRTNIRLGLCTNKPSKLSNKVLLETGLMGLFDGIVSGDTLSVKKPNPDPLLAVIGMLDVDKKDVLFVGDSSIDYQTSCSAGVDFLLFKSGYDEEFEAVFEGVSFNSYLDLIKLLKVANES